MQSIIEAKSLMVVYDIFFVFFIIAFVFNSKFRMIFLVLIPTTLKGKMRKFILINAFVQVLTGPFQNMMRNIREVTGSADCILSIFGNISEFIANKAKRLFKQISAKVEDFSNQVRKRVKKVQKNFKSFFKIMKKLNDVMNNMIDKCYHHMRKPYHDCNEKFDVAHAKCKKKLKGLKIICKIVPKLKSLCKMAKVGEAICLLGKFVKQGVKVMAKGVAGNLGWIKKQFYFKIEFTRVYDVRSDVNASGKKHLKKSLKSNTVNINRFKGVLFMVLEFMNIFWLILAILRAKGFMKKFQKEFEFENFFYDATEESIQDILPLGIEERKHYCKYTQLSLTEFERSGLEKDCCRFIMYFALSIFYIAGDELVFMAVQLIERKSKTSIQKSKNLKKLAVKNSKNFTLVDDLASFIDKKQGKMGNMFTFDHCYPKAHPPNYAVNKNILFLFAFAFLALTFGPFIVRLRHHIMFSFVKSKLKQKRHTWLKNEIINQRFTQNYERSKPKAKIKFSAKIKMFLCRAIKFLMCRPKKSTALNDSDHPKNFLCHSCRNFTESANLIQCPNFTCQTIFCRHVQLNILNVCTQCNSTLNSESLVYPFD